MTGKVYSLAVWILLAFGVAATGVQISRLAWAVFGADPLPEGLLSEGGTLATDANADGRIDALISAAPFGTFTRGAASGWSDTGTTDQLTLHAVRLSEDTSASTATLSISGGAMDIYRIGEDVGGLGKLRHIEARRVIVEIGGQDMLVAFPVPARASRLPPLYAAMAAEYSAGTVVGGPGLEPASELAENSIRTQMNANPQVLIESFGLERAPDGYIVGPETPPILLAAGLQPGDKVVKVNGSQVGDAASDRLLFEQAVASGRARVEVVRGGQTLVLSFPLK